MPIKIWDIDGSGAYTSTIQTNRRTTLGGEEFRPEADALDANIDQVLDRATELAASGSHARSNRALFVKRWAIGRSITESGILQSSHMEAESRSDLCLAMARKCRLGVRASGDPETRWRGLIPNRDAEPKRIEDDIFGLGMWLQDQELEDAIAAFGGGLHNAKQIWSGESLRHRKFRDCLGTWFGEYDADEQARLYVIPQYAVIAKALRRRWPSRGPGSAKRPAHYEPDALLAEIRRLLEPIAKQLLSESGRSPHQRPRRQAPTPPLL
jgi:hypothetical protein